MSQRIVDLLHPSGPRRMLSLDGGGIRGVVTLEILARIEALLRSHYKRDDLVLSDHYHFIGGTSTGAIIACGLSLGMPVAELQRFYLDCATEMFRRSGWRRRAHHLYSAKPLREKMKGVFGEDTLLGSERFRSLLLVVTRNAKTDSPWFITNNVNAKFNDPSLPDCNLNIPVWKLVRASTAAPIFFAAEEIDDALGHGVLSRWAECNQTPPAGCGIVRYWFFVDDRHGRRSEHRACAPLRQTSLRFRPFSLGQPVRPPPARQSSRSRLCGLRDSRSIGPTMC